MDGCPGVKISPRIPASIKPNEIVATLDEPILSAIIPDVKQPIGLQYCEKYPRAAAIIAEVPNTEVAYGVI